MMMRSPPNHVIHKQRSLWQSLFKGRCRIVADLTTTTTTTTTANTTTANTSTSTGRSVVRRTVTPEERKLLRAARRDQALQLQAGGGAGGGATATATTTTAAAGTGTTTTTNSFKTTSSAASRIISGGWVWYLGMGIPTALLAWGLNDENSPPAKFSAYIGLTGWIKGYTDEFSKPALEKLLPSHADMPDMPPGIQIQTLVLDLEQTLVSSTWDRKHGWRHAKRPGADEFLHEMAQYYEIVLFSNSPQYIAEPVVASLDKVGAFRHHLYREHTHHYNGVPVKDLDRLNRNLKQVVVLDDDRSHLQFHPDNVIQIKPYEDPTDRTDDSLKRITPFLIEIAREKYEDIPALLRQYRGMDADAIADEMDRRLMAYESHVQSRNGLGGWAAQSRQRSWSSIQPELSPETTSFSPSNPKQLTAKDIAGSRPPQAEASGLMGWLQKRNEEKEEQTMRKMEKWNEIMMKKQQEKQAEAERQSVLNQG